MNQIFHLLWIVFAACFKPRIGIFDCSVLSFQVLPTGLEYDPHRESTKYLSVMELGRTDLMIRSGMLMLMKREYWLPVLSTTDIQFYKELQPFQHYKLRTRLVCWDEKWLYMEQRFESDQGIHAIAMLRGLFRDHEGSVPPRQLLQRSGYRGESPPFPTQMHCLLAYDKAGMRVRSNAKAILTRAM